MSRLSIAQRVFEFSKAADDPIPDEPRVPTAEETDFLIRMLMDEILEVLSIHYDSQLAKSKLYEMIRTAKSLPKEPEPTVESFADGVCDIIIYALHSCCKMGIDMDPVFDEVMNANMRKRNPETGKFDRRADGKIVKPKGFVPPDVKSAICKKRVTFVEVGPPEVKRVPDAQPGTEVFSAAYQGEDRVSARVGQMNSMLLMSIGYVLVVFMIKFIKENVVT